MVNKRFTIIFVVVIVLILMYARRSKPEMWADELFLHFVLILKLVQLDFNSTCDFVCFELH